MMQNPSIWIIGTCKQSVKLMITTALENATTMGLQMAAAVPGLLLTDVARCPGRRLAL
jgi:hypothetical protein